LTRVLASLVYSSGRGRLRPHGNGGFEFWSDGIDVRSNLNDQAPTFVTARHMVQYAGGVELEATPKITLIADVIGRHILGAGRVETQSLQVVDPRITSAEAVLALPKGIRKITLAPGLKWNLKGTMLLSVNALVPLFDQGVHDKFTPVFGLDWTF